MWFIQIIINFNIMSHQLNFKLTMFELTKEMLNLARSTKNTHAETHMIEDKPLKKLVKVSTLSNDDLNKLQAKILKAKLMGSVQLKQLEEEFELEKQKIEFNKNVDIHAQNPCKPNVNNLINLNHQRSVHWIQMTLLYH